jgi:2-succinyl-5-enolpyruvyl-6-hydroxy-3-cyclohexene-1-carboxylate synthase
VQRFPALFVFLGFALTSRYHFYPDVTKRSRNCGGITDTSRNAKRYKNGHAPNVADAFALPPIVVRRGLGVSITPIAAKATIPRGFLSPNDASVKNCQKRHTYRTLSPRGNIGPSHQTTNDDDESSLPQSLIEEEDDSNINRSIGTKNVIPNKNDTNTIAEGRALLSPNHLLYPETFRKFDAPLQSSLPLFEALRIMKQSLTTFLTEANNLQPSPCWASQSSSSSKPAVLRIEQKISHNVEPLCWLQAQIDSSQPFVTAIDHPALYMETAEETFETAVFGSSRTFRGRLEEDAAWWGQLPNRARVYGGSRFDAETEPSEEWKSFSRGFWMLPAVELRREKEINSINSEREDKAGTSTFTTTTTLATHLVADDDGDFVASARHVLSILEGLTDTSTPAIPPTKIPPIVSRSSTYHRRIKKKHASAILSSPNATTTEIESSTLSSQDAQEVYERGVAAAVKEFSRTKRRQIGDLGNTNYTSPDSITNSDNPVGDDNSDPALLEKVVLARRLDLQFDSSAQDNIRALDILRKWKYASRPGGHLIYICPNIKGDYEFFGCTPERLFQVVSTPAKGECRGDTTTTTVVSEALAGTRPRGSTAQADQKLSRELFTSAKDQSENEITGRFIMEAFNELNKRGWIQQGKTLESNNISTIGEETKEDVIGNYDYNDGSTVNSTRNIKGRYFVRRLRHLQHICQQFRCQLSSSDVSKDVIQYLLAALHPTPAVGGYPKGAAMNFIREYESIGFDRGFYAGPFGFVGNGEAEIVVAIRSGLISRGKQTQNQIESSSSSSIRIKNTRPKVSVYAGAGIVPGSTLQGEWSETSYKLGVVSSIFPQSPLTLQSALTPNSAWATAFVEELVRNGITQFYICPGSRSTPLVAAIAKIVRSNLGVVHALSVHDERGAAFRALGYGRGVGRPAAVLTSSGTAVANLYPAIMEASMDAIPMVVLTADRPYESRDTGANQAIDQVKVYSQSYVRWFRDISPPHDDVPISVALADAAHGVSLSRRSMGPVHLNIQFRENLAPDAGPIRNDGRIGSVTKFDSLRFTDAAGFQRWSLGGSQWTKTSLTHRSVDSRSLLDIIRLISESKRGMIVVGNIRKPSGENQESDPSRTVQLITNFALSIGFPIFAGVQSGSLRFESSAVVPFAEHLLRSPLINNNLKPDLIIQFGAPLISTEIPNVIKQTLYDDGALNHVLVHPHHPTERHNPEFTVSHTIDSDIDSFLVETTKLLNIQGNTMLGSQLAPLVQLGCMLREEMPAIVEEAGAKIREEDSSFHGITEPEVVMTLSKILTSGKIPDSSLFLSNSMPVRDSEAFLYPTCSNCTSSLVDVGVNRGASGIDGVIASAAGFADSTGRPASLLIGDVAALHDINSLHALRTDPSTKENQSKNIHPLTTIILNNDGGGIFSFLPIAKHGSDVAFEEFFATPTNTFSFEKGAQAFDLPFIKVQSLESLENAYVKSVRSQEPSIIEVVVASREKNVVIHKTISALVNKFLAGIITPDTTKVNEPEILPLKHTRVGTLGDSSSTELGKKTMVLIHGWMGDKSEWREVESSMMKSLPEEWSILSVDLPGHGSSRLRGSSRVLSIQEALRMVDRSDNFFRKGLGLDEMAISVCRTLKSHGVENIDALAGYSLGGRVALAMKRLSMTTRTTSDKNYRYVVDVIDEETKMILVSTYPGEIVGTRAQSANALDDKNIERLLKDNRLANEIEIISNRDSLTPASPEVAPSIWSEFLNRWYSATLWGKLRTHEAYTDMASRRVEALSRRGCDIAAVLRQCSPPRCSNEDWRGVMGKNTLFIAGESDKKYCNVGRQWFDVEPSLGYVEVPNKGHALLIEAAEDVAVAIISFLLQERDEVLPFGQNDTKIWEATFISSITKNERSSSTQQIDTPSMSSIGSLDFESFNINLIDEKEEDQGVLGVGWGLEAEAKSEKALKQRLGFVVQVTSKDGLQTGIGEISPLDGLHMESFEEVGNQLESIANRLSNIGSKSIPSFNAKQILALDGALDDYIASLSSVLLVGSIFPSVRSGLEMAILSLASCKVRTPIHQALVSNTPDSHSVSSSISTLPLNGLLHGTNQHLLVSVIRKICILPGR